MLLDAPRAARLCRLLLVRAGHTAGPRENDPPLSERGRREIEAVRRRWEWAERVVSSPRRRARETARILSRGGPVGLDPELRPLDRGRLAGLRPEELEAVDPARFKDWATGREDAAFPGGETRSAFLARVDRAHEKLRSGPYFSVLVVSHGEPIRALVERLVGRALPPDRPWIGELALVTRDTDGRWRLGRRSSDPEPLRTQLERTGLLGRDGDPWDDRYAAPLQLRLDAWASR